MNAMDVLERDFLKMRHSVLDVAAALDRIDRAEGAEAAQRDPRMTMLREAVHTLTSDKPDRAERIQMIFSIPVDNQLQQKP